MGGIADGQKYDQGLNANADVPHVLGGKPRSGHSEKPDRAGIYPKARLCWKGYDFDILNELTDERLVNAGGSSKSAFFNAEGKAKARKLLKAYGIEIDTSE